MKKLLWWVSLVLAAGSGVAVAFPSSDLPDLIQKVRPSVVSINVDETVERKGGGGRTLQTPFGQFFINPFQRGPRRVMVAGSGFVIAVKNKKIIPATPCVAPGVTCYIITNNHVVRSITKGRSTYVKKSGSITIHLNDGKTEFQSRKVASDDATDIAILTVPKGMNPRLHSLSLGDSSKVRVGEAVIAIGNPLGRLPGTVSLGIISAEQRKINAAPYDSYLQTDAAINRGNSGGPLLDMNGAVVGINTAIYSASGGSEGLGFAIPSNRAQLIASKLIKYGKVERAALGVTVQRVTPEIASSLKLKSPQGALVQYVSPVGPAFKKLKVGDVILRFSGKEVRDSSDLPWMVAEQSIGDRVSITVLRNGRRVRVHIVLASLDKLNTMGAYKPGEQKSSASSGAYIPSLKMRLAPNRSQRGTTSVRGLRILSVDGDSNAAVMGLRPGMVITELNRIPVRTVTSLRRIVRRALRSSRKGQRVGVMLKVYVPSLARPRGGKGTHLGGGELFVGLWLQPPTKKKSK